MWILLLILPTLLFADVDPADVPAPATEVKMATTLSDAPQAPSAKQAPANNDVAKTVLPNVSTPISEPVGTAANKTAEPTANTVALRLKPSASAPVVLTLPADEVKAGAQDAGIVADGQKWMSVEHAVTLVGYVDKAAIDKDLTVSKGTVVWTATDKAEQLTVVDEPTAAKLLEVDHMGKVEVKEPRVLYYAAPMQVMDVSAPTVSPAEQKSLDDAAKRRGSSSTMVDARLRGIEGVLRKGNPLFGRKLYLYDAQGQQICRIDQNSPIGWLTFSEYVGHTAVFVGELHDNGGDLVLTVHSIRMR